MIGVSQTLPVTQWMGREMMQMPEDVAQMLRLRAAGLGIKHIARKMGCSKNTVRRYLRAGGWVAYKVPERPGAWGASAHEFSPHRSTPRTHSRLGFKDKCLVPTVQLRCLLFGIQSPRTMSAPCRPPGVMRPIVRRYHVLLENHCDGGIGTPVLLRQRFKR